MSSKRKSNNPLGRPKKYTDEERREAVLASKRKHDKMRRARAKEEEENARNAINHILKQIQVISEMKLNFKN